MRKLPRQPSNERPRLLYKNGRFWFSRESERRLLFVLTLILLGAGLLAKVGLL